MYTIIKAAPTAVCKVLPTEDELSNLSIGDNVKITFKENGSNESMWIVLTDILENNNLVGTLNNDPLNTPSISYGDEVEFSLENIVDIFSEEKYPVEDTPEGNIVLY